MSMLSSSCCCGKCYFGAKSTDPNATACNHGTTEVLELRNPRPGHSNNVRTVGYTGADCSCAGTYRLSETCPQSDTIEVDYIHFHPNTRTYTWFYEKVDGLNIWPPCTHPCCGYDSAAPGFNDVACCSGTTSQCSTTYRQFTGSPGNSTFASKFQQDAINPGTSPHRSSNSVADDCEFGDSYLFLEGVANSSSSSQYNHYVVNSSGVVVQTPSTRKLEETMLCVVHKEKWWVRDYNSLNHDDNSSVPDGSVDDQASGSRTPKYWIFACTGVPLYSWEIKEVSSLTTTQQDQVLVAINNGDPIPEDLADILESDGILLVKDYERTDGKIIKKTLKTSNGSVGIEYFWGRPGGWTYVCQQFDQSPATAILKFPQIARRSREPNASGSDFGGTNNCFTAAPIPTNNCVCNSTGGPGGSCDPCSGLGTDCNEGLAQFCGGATDTCFQDIIVGNCRGVWAQFTHYYLNLPGSSSAYECGVSNDVYICRVDPGGTCDFGNLPDEISHPIPEPVSASIRNGLSSNPCCGGDGTINFGSVECPATTPNAPDCDDPSVWGPNV